VTFSTLKKICTFVLPVSELPTRLQVARHFMFLKENKYASNTEIVPHLAQTVIDIWNRTGIPSQIFEAVKTSLVDEEESSSSHEIVDENEWKSCSNDEGRNLKCIPTIALETERYGVSNRVAAAISTAILVAYGIITSENRIDVIDHHKIWRVRK
jgi:hypothetical protein